MHKKLFTLTAVSLGILLSFSSRSQNLVSYQSIVNYTVSGIRNALTFAGLNGDTLALYPVRVYSVTYNTLDENGAPTLASGAISIPDFSCDQTPIIGIGHGTEFDKTNVPSQGGYLFEPILYSTNGYVTVQADNLGMGINSGMQLYIHAETEAQATIDLLRAARELVDSLDVDFILNGEVFITGYSQGAHTSMATHKKIQEDQLSNEFNVLASINNAGPYDLNGNQFDLIFDGDSSYYQASFLPLTLASYQRAYGNLYSSYDEIYDAPYDSLIEAYLTDGTYSGTEWGNMLPDTYYDFMVDSVLDNMLANPFHPIRQALEENSLYDWVPENSVTMTYCGNDSLVTPLNSIFTYDSMLNAGAQDINLINQNPTGTHETCYFGAILTSLEIMEQKKSNCSNLGLRDSEVFPYKIFPNPTDGVLFIEHPEGTNELQFYLYSIEGKQINFTLNKVKGRYELTLPKEMDSQSTGVFLLQIFESDELLGTVRVLLNR